MAQLCVSCGKLLEPGVHYCSSCGAAVASPPPQNPSVASTSADRFQPVGMPQRRRSVLPKVLVFILIVGAFVVGGMVYSGKKVREKALAVTQSTPGHANDKRVDSAKQ